MTSVLDVVRIVVTDGEREAGALEPHRFEVAKGAMVEDGMVVLDDLVPVDIVDSLAAAMSAELPETAAAHAGRPTKYPGHLQQPPPSDPDLLFPDVLANPVVLALCRTLMGPSVGSAFYAANVNMPGSVAQATHCDLPQLWPDQHPAHASPYGMIANMPLVDTSELNATELWPGTHLDGRTHTSRRLHRDIPQAWLDERRVERAPVRVPQRKGSVLLRDLRVWHCGVANTSEQVRTMIGVGYAPYWYKGFTIPIPDEVGARLTELGVPPVVEVDGSTTFSRQLADSVRQGVHTY